MLKKFTHLECFYRMSNTEDEPNTTDVPLSPLRKSRYRKKLGYLPMTTITSLDVPTDEDNPESSHGGKYSPYMEKDLRSLIY